MGITSRHETAHLKSWRGLFALTSHDLRINLICAGVEQLHRLILQLPKLAVVGEVFILYPLTRHQLGRFNS
ncbi:hypothetical protein AABC73_14920 [Pseudomonas sp. G.S.17]|uniref:hypothetical protein n=1 Tax=Pseudomonas sp. G.S.17 TaxID=3137451 RepID=UPI00311CD3A2